MEEGKRTRGHDLEIGRHVHASTAGSNPSVRIKVVKSWNALPAEVLSGSTVNSFKGKIEQLVVQGSCRLSGPVFVCSGVS